MKYQPGDKILVLLTDEEGTVLEIMNEKMVLIDVKGVKFPIYTDQIDFPYFKMFSEKGRQKKRQYLLTMFKMKRQRLKRKGTVYGFPLYPFTTGIFLMMMLWRNSNYTW